MITSTSSSQVKHVISLLSKARERKKNKEYVVEGVRMVSEVPADLLVKIYMSERFHSNNPEYVHELVKKQGMNAEGMIDAVTMISPIMYLTECHRHRHHRGLWRL